MRCSKVAKGELGRIRVNINGVPNIGWFKWRHEIICAVETKTNDECLGCKLERGCVGVQVEGEPINLGLCLRWAFIIVIKGMVFWISPVTGGVRDIIVW